MKLSFDRKALLSAFAAVSPVASNKSPKPILQNVKVTATNDGVSLCATDMEVAVERTVTDCAASEEATLLLPASRFGMLLKETDSPLLVLESDEPGSVVVKADRSKFTLQTQDPNAYPPLPPVDATSHYTIESRNLTEAVRRTSYACDPQNSRYALGGALLELTENELSAVATDGRRLAALVVPVSYEGEQLTNPHAPIVPAKTLALIQRMLPNDSSPVKLIVNPNDIVVLSQGTTIFARLLEGRFPIWRGVMPDPSDYVHVSMHVASLHSTLRQASVVCTEESRGINFAFGDGSLELSAQAADVGRAKVDLPISYNGPLISCSLDHQFVAEFLRSLPSESTVTMMIKGKQDAVLMSTDDNARYLIMPMSQE